MHNHYIKKNHKHLKGNSQILNMRNLLNNRFTTNTSQDMRNIFLFILLIVVLCISNSSNAQVTIGSATPPSQGALLDLKMKGDGTSTKGLLLPRLSLVDIETMEPIFATTNTDLTNLKKQHVGLIVYHVGGNNIDPGVYTWNGEQWLSSSGVDSSPFSKWFYMPSFPIDVSQDVEISIDLYQEYSNQFGSIQDFPLIERGKLKFAIIGYDENSFLSAMVDDVTSSLKYRANPNQIGPRSFLNIICQITN